MISTIWFIRSVLSVQQMQPFCNATRLSSLCPTTPPCWINVASILTSPISFTITAKRIPFLFERMRFTNVVFPLPRYPVRSRIGISLLFISRIDLYRMSCPLDIPRHQASKNSPNRNTDTLSESLLDTLFRKYVYLRVQKLTNYEK